MNGSKGVIIVPMDETVALHHKSQFDLTLQINYLSISLLNHGHIAAGALFFKEIGMRYSKDPPPIAYTSREQIDFQISNVQIINLHSVEHTNTRQTFIKWDMLYTPLHYRSIFQMVDANDYRLWIVDGKEWTGKYLQGQLYEGMFASFRKQIALKNIPSKTGGPLK